MAPNLTSAPAVPSTIAQPRPSRAYTSAYAIGQSLAAGVGATNGHGALARVAAARGLPLTSMAVGGSVAHWPTMATNTTNGNGGFAKVLQDLSATKKANNSRPFYADGVSSNVLYLIMHGLNHLIAGGGSRATPAEVMAIRTLISRCLSHRVLDDSGFVTYGANNAAFGGGWGAVSDTTRNSGAGYLGTQAVGDYVPLLTQTATGDVLPPGSVVAFVGLVQSGETGTITFHDDTNNVALGTLDISAAAPPTNVRVFTTPASGTYTLTFGGQTTSALAAAATAAQIATALAALSSIGAGGNVAVTGAGATSAATTITLQGTLAASDAAITASAGTISRIMSPWIKRFVIGTDIPAYQIITVRATVTALGGGTSAFRIDSLHYETPLHNPVMVAGTFRPYNSSTYGFADIATRDAAVIDFNTQLKAMCAEFNRPGLEAQAVYVDPDSQLNKQAAYWVPWSIPVGRGGEDGLHWNDDGHGLAASVMDLALLPANLPVNDQYNRARAA